MGSLNRLLSPLDGLNKPIGAADMRYYCRTYFSRISMQQCGVALDWDRPYVIQVARFDPSKGGLLRSLSHAAHSPEV